MMDDRTLNVIRRDDGRVEIVGDAPEQVKVSVDLVGDALPQYLRTVLTFSDDFGRVVTYRVTGAHRDHGYLQCELVDGTNAELPLSGGGS